MTHVDLRLDVLLEVSDHPLDLDQHFHQMHHLHRRSGERRTRNQIAKEKIGELRMSEKHSARVVQQRLLLVVVRQTLEKDHRQDQQLNDQWVASDELGQLTEDGAEGAIELVAIAEKEQTFAMLSEGFFFAREQFLRLIFVVDHFPLNVVGQGEARNKQQSEIVFDQDQSITFDQREKLGNLAKEVDQLHRRVVLNVHGVHVRGDLVRSEFHGDHRRGRGTRLTSGVISSADRLKTRPIRGTQDQRRTNLVPAHS